MLHFHFTLPDKYTISIDAKAEFIHMCSTIHYYHYKKLDIIQQLIFQEEIS